MNTSTCKNCGLPISATFTNPRDGYVVWAHENQHTVCDWREGMEPTTIVATPVGTTDDLQAGYDAGYAKLLLDPTRGRRFSAGYALGVEHRLADDARADPHWPSDYDQASAAAL